MKGIDVSNNNGNIDFYKVKNSGIECVYIKASEGYTFKDPFLETNYENSKQQGLKIGFYHFLVGSSEPEKQAENFFNLIKNKQSDLKPCLDIEKSNFNVMDYTKRFIEKFKSICNLELCIYTGPYFANKYLNEYLNTYSCWIAHYGVSNPMATTIWGTNYAGHQYTEDGHVDGISGSVDMNYFYDSILISSPLKAGWNKYNNEWKYCINENNLKFYTDCWQEIDSEWYYFDSNGNAKHDTWIYYNYNYYYLKSNCKMAKNEWILINEKWYYLTSNGSMKTGWFEYKDSYYFLNDDGSMKTGWLKYKDDCYFLNDDGIMRVGWLYNNNNWYYFNYYGKLVKDNVIDGLQINSDGIAIKFKN